MSTTELHPANSKGRYCRTFEFPNPAQIEKFARAEAEHRWTSTHEHFHMLAGRTFETVYADALAKKRAAYETQLANAQADEGYWLTADEVARLEALKSATFPITREGNERFQENTWAQQKIHHIARERASTMQMAAE